MTTDTQVQGTLDGETAERVECEYYDGCHNDALFVDELRVNTDYGEDTEVVRACPSCAREHVEPESIDEADTWTRMKPADRYVGEEPEPETVYVVAVRYDGSPHPGVEGVYDNEEAADEHMQYLREKSFQEAVVAWEKIEQTVESRMA